MIYIARPVTKTHKTVEGPTERQLNSDLRERNPVPMNEASSVKKNRVEASPEELIFNVKLANNVLSQKNNKFKFEVHEGTKRNMVKLIDTDTDEIVREIPSEKILDLIANIWEMVGILVDERG